MTSTTPYLQLRSVSKRFGKVSALDDVSLDVHEGEFLFLLGPSGCGKTTLLRIIAGLEEPSAGQVIQAGADVTKLPPSRRDFGIVFQSYALFPNLTVAQNIAYGLENRRLAKAQVAERVNELLQLVGLPGLRGAVPGAAFRRSTAAGGIGARPGDLARAAPARRAAFGAGCARARPTAPGSGRPPAPAGRHDHHGHTRPGGGPDDGRPGGRHGSRPPRTDRYAREVYRSPATPFVADFVGLMNFLPGVMAPAGSRKCGAAAHCCRCPPSTSEVTPPPTLLLAAK